ncbi:hypothetical protein [Hymenobacter negativus]|uniref:Uncharacterized protein n=1 Tax=Hymenobacter negativus TaxID=2795026 RepID=A0ABS3QJG0_9BACT|nr:hypothetical protein [Hymenobacter negativus]MBO2010840.1 hypothetical protein [Hymenobacter negativus]
MPITHPPASRGPRILLMVALAAAVFFLAPPALRQFTAYFHLPLAGSFDLGTLNVPVLAAVQFFAAVSMAYVPWRFLFPGLYGYVRDCMEGKLFENLTADLLGQLPAPTEWNTQAQTQISAERRRISQFQFTIRCVRFLFSLLPFFVFLVLATSMVSSSLTVVPH